MKKFIPLTELVPYLTKRAVCVVKDHDIRAMIKWSPEVICMHIVCSRCGKFLGHMDLPNVGSKAKKESLH